MTEDSQTVVYKSRRLKMVPVMGMLQALCFTVLALAIPGPSVPILRWLMLALACSMFVISVCLQLMLGFTSIQISTSGIAIRYWRFSTMDLEWSDVTEFYPKRLMGRNLVAFTYSPAYQEKLRRKRYAGIKMGMLPDTYGFTAEALAERLNERRAAAFEA